jgi:SanA protein
MLRWKAWRHINWRFRFVLIAAVLVVALVLAANVIITIYARDLTYNDVSAIPYNKVGMVPGTSKHIHGGKPNQYFDNRINAAAELFKSKKISYIVISGDNSRKSYNEPRDMKNALVAQGIPDSVIYLDYAGFRTYDSVIRMNEIFGQNKFTIISQKFQNERAIYIAGRFNLNVIGYNATDVNVYYGFKTKMREKLARVKVFMDLTTHKKPRFLGEKIEIR